MGGVSVPRLEVGQEHRDVYGIGQKLTPALTT